MPKSRGRYHLRPMRNPTLVNPRFASQRSALDMWSTVAITSHRSDSMNPTDPDFVKIDGTPEIGVVAIINRATEGPFDEQPSCEKDIPGEAGIKLAGIALCIDRTPEMQARSQEVVQETILIFSADWSIQQLKIDVG